MDETTVYNSTTGKSTKTKNQYLQGFLNSGWTTSPTSNPVDNSMLRGGVNQTMIDPKPETGAAGMNAEIVSKSNATTDQYNKDLEAKAKSAESQKNTSLEDYISGLTGQKGKNELTADEYSKSVDLIKPELDKINADINAEVESTRQKLLALDKNPRGLFGGALEQEKNRIETESLHRQASMAVKQMAIQGRYDSAKEIADRAVDVQFEKETNRIEALRVNYEDKKDLFTESEKREFESKQADRERELDKKKEDAKLISDMAIDAIKGGASPETAAKIMGAGSVEEATKLSGKYLATAENEITEIDGRKAIVNKRTGFTRFLDGGSQTITQRTVNGQPVDGYTMIAGNDPYDIAQRFGTTMEGLKALNPTITDWTKIQPGAVLNVPSQNSGKMKALEIILSSGKFTKDQVRQITDAISNGEDPFIVIKNNARSLMGAPIASDTVKFESAKQQMTDLDRNLKDFYAKGGNTSLFRGTIEDIEAKLGAVRDPELRRIATAISANLAIYRNAVSGTAYSVQEGKEIKSIFPGIDNTQGLNNAIISGRMQAFDSVIDGNYQTVLGSTYNQLKQSQTKVIDPVQNIKEYGDAHPEDIPTLKQMQLDGLTIEQINSWVNQNI